MRARMVVLSVMALLPLAAAPAAADPGGVQHSEIPRTCTTFPDLYTSCVEVHTLSNSVASGSGSVMVFQHTSYDFTIVGDQGGAWAGCSVTDSGRQDTHYVVRDGEVQQSHYGAKGETRLIDCFGTTQVCGLRQIVTFANGEVRADRNEVICRPQAV